MHPNGLRQSSVSGQGSRSHLITTNPSSSLVIHNGVTELNNAPSNHTRFAKRSLPKLKTNLMKSDGRRRERGDLWRASDHQDSLIHQRINEESSSILSIRRSSGSPPGSRAFNRQNSKMNSLASILTTRGQHETRKDVITQATGVIQAHARRQLVEWGIMEDSISNFKHDQSIQQHLADSDEDEVILVEGSSEPLDCASAVILLD